MNTKLECTNYWGRWINEKTAIEIFELLEKFAEYGFNKSHSAAYALIAYQTAWLKTYYPAEYYAANLSSDINDSVTTIPVYNTNPFTTSGTVQIGDEKIAYTGVDGTNLTGCTRASESTSAVSHVAYAQVTQV